MMTKEKRYPKRDKHFEAFDESKPLPKDFWNYNVNPITGYRVDRMNLQQRAAEAKKYGQLQQPLPNGIGKD